MIVTFNIYPVGEDMSWMTAAFTGFLGGAVAGATQAHREPEGGGAPPKDYQSAKAATQEVYANTPKAPDVASWGMGFEHPIHIHVDPPELPYSKPGDLC